MSALTRAAHLAGTAVRVLRGLMRVLPGVAGAALVSVGLGQLAGHVFHRGLSAWVTCAVAGAFLLKIGAEVNAAPPPRREDPGG